MSARKGIDFTQGQVLLARGRRLTDRDLMLAAAMNHPALSVYRRPKVAVLGTGDELLMPGSTPESSARSFIQTASRSPALAQSEGAEVIDLGIARDKLEDIAAAVRRARDSGADVLLTSGGASVGDHDLVQRALKARRSRSFVLAGGAASGPADDARPARRHACARRARQSGVVLRLLVPVSGAADPHFVGPRPTIEQKLEVAPRSASSLPAE